MMIKTVSMARSFDDPVWIASRHRRALPRVPYPSLRSNQKTSNMFPVLLASQTPNRALLTSHARVLLAIARRTGRAAPRPGRRKIVRAGAHEAGGSGKLEHASRPRRGHHQPQPGAMDTSLLMPALPGTPARPRDGGAGMAATRTGDPPSGPASLPSPRPGTTGGRPGSGRPAVTGLAGAWWPGACHLDADRGGRVAVLAGDDPGEILLRSRRARLAGSPIAAQAATVRPGSPEDRRRFCTLTISPGDTWNRATFDGPASVDSSGAPGRVASRPVARLRSRPGALAPRRAPPPDTDGDVQQERS